MFQILDKRAYQCHPTYFCLPQPTKWLVVLEHGGDGGSVVTVDLGEPALFVIAQNRVGSGGVVDSGLLSGIVVDVVNDVVERGGVGGGLTGSVKAPLLDGSVGHRQLLSFSSRGELVGASLPATVGDAGAPAVRVVSVGLGFSLGIGGTGDAGRYLL